MAARQVDGVAIADTLHATYYESDGLTEISNTDSCVLASWTSLSALDAGARVTKELGILGPVVARDMEVV